MKRSIQIFAAAAILLASPPSAYAQSGNMPKFEVASIKRCRPGGRAGVFGQPLPNRITVNCTSLAGLIHQAYITFANGVMNVSPEKIIPMDKSPAWIESDSWTIQAKAGGLDPGQGMMLGPMMQALLEDRFRLKVHRETREAPEYALAVTGEGPRLQSAAAGNCVRQDLDHPLARSAPGQALLPFCGFALGASGGFSMRGATMAQLCVALSSRVDRKVVDRTAIQGTFDIDLNWTGDSSSLPAPPPPPPPPGELPLVKQDPAEVTAAIQSALRKLGLKLEPIRGSEEALVIDHAERPTEN